jgi:hypothetical protein
MPGICRSLGSMSRLMPSKRILVNLSKSETSLRKGHHWFVELLGLVTTGLTGKILVLALQALP